MSWAIPRRAGLVASVVCLTACAASQVEMVGGARSPLLPQQVRVYLEPPTAPYVEIARIETSSRHAFAFTSAAQFEVIVTRLRDAAAKVGANAVVLSELSRGAPVGLGAGAGIDSMGARGTVDIGLAGGIFVAQKHARATAVYLEPPH